MYPDDPDNRPRPYRVGDEPMKVPDPPLGRFTRVLAGVLAAALTLAVLAGLAIGVVALFRWLL